INKFIIKLINNNHIHLRYNKRYFNYHKININHIFINYLDLSKIKKIKIKKKFINILRIIIEFNSNSEYFHFVSIIKLIMIIENIIILFSFINYNIIIN